MCPPRSVSAIVLGVAAVILSAVTPSAGAVTLLHVDDFQNGSVNGWQRGNPNPFPPVVVFGVGPSGAGDHSLHLESADGGGAGGKLIAWNQSSNWTGDYTAAGVERIELDVFNFSGSLRSFRVGVIGQGGAWVSDVVPVVDTGSWETISFPFTAGDLMRVSGSDVALTLATVREIRIFDNPNVDIRGAEIEANAYLDNISALPAVPELSGAAFLVLVAGLAAVRRTRRYRM